MGSKKLTPAESKWIKQLQELVANCPSKRMGAYTTGDAEIAIYDKPVFDTYRADNNSDMRDDVHIHEQLGTVLARVQMPFNVEGVCG